MATNHLPIVRKPGEGHRVAIVGDVYRFLATGKEMGGNCATFEAIVPPGGGPPPHIHSREEESFYVLEGQMTFQLRDDRFVAEAGTFFNMPVDEEKEVTLVSITAREFLADSDVTPRKATVTLQVMRMASDEASHRSAEG